MPRAGERRAALVDLERERAGALCDDLRAQPALANRPAGVRAYVSKRIHAVAVPADDAQLEPPDRDQLHAALGEVRQPANLDHARSSQPNSSIAFRRNTFSCQAAGIVPATCATSSVSQ